MSLPCLNKDLSQSLNDIYIYISTAINYCASNPCNNAGLCVNKADGYECQCRPGYTGNHCQIDEDECVTSPCAEGATCVDKVGTS